ncbi:hypothetical protein BOTCAL_0222g00080 [Botryotinia calthae]|uniref:Uncharacterized protein n=1 Tax=Botryotinia calthae TaxID=38488 RepID=A0A4Y8CY38_9HELO|nr:hypothetical protein BOTCAL_0222g00080 [Botryotinia calthae]
MPREFSNSTVTKISSDGKRSSLLIFFNGSQTSILGKRVDGSMGLLLRSSSCCASLTGLDFAVQLQMG